MRSGTISELFEEVRTNLATIKEKAQEAKKDERIQNLLRPKIKSCLEHLRSCLDFSAHDIYEKLSTTNNKPYFPYAFNGDVASFNTSINRSHPNLQVLDSNIYDLIESIQPHITSSDWLLKFCRRTNTEKHQDLSKQERENSNSTNFQLGNIINSVNSSGKITIKIGQIIENGKKVNKKPIDITIDPSNPNHSFEDIKNELDGDLELTYSYDWVNFTFKGSNENVVDFIEEALTKIEDFRGKLEALL